MVTVLFLESLYLVLYFILVCVFVCLFDSLSIKVSFTWYYSFLFISHLAPTDA